MKDDQIENLKELVLECVDDILKLKVKCDELEAKDKEQDGYIHWRTKQL